MTGILGRAEATIGSAIGNKNMQERGEAAVRQAEIDKQKSNVTGDNSSKSASVGPFTANTEGGAIKNHPDRTEGSWDQKVGSVKENVGSFVGSDSLEESGNRQHAEGTGKKASGQMSDTATGIGESIKGTVGGAAAYVTGNNVKKNEMDQKAEDGKARVQSVRDDQKKEHS